MDIKVTETRTVGMNRDMVRNAALRIEITKTPDGQFTATVMGDGTFATAPEQDDAVRAVKLAVREKLSNGDITPQKMV